MIYKLRSLREKFVKNHCCPLNTKVFVRGGVLSDWAKCFFKVFEWQCQREIKGSFFLTLYQNHFSDGKMILRRQMNKKQNKTKNKQKECSKTYIYFFSFLIWFCYNPNWKGPPPYACLSINSFGHCNALITGKGWFLVTFCPTGTYSVSVSMTISDIFASFPFHRPHPFCLKHHRLSKLILLVLQNPLIGT